MVTHDGLEREDYKFGNNDERLGKVKLLYRVNELTEVLSMAKSTIWKLTKYDSMFPKPFKIGSMTVWHIDDINEWVDYIRGKKED